jgi:protein tyrosine/serine phosphatase
LAVSVLVRRLLTAALAALVLVVPFFYYRASYTHSKRLRTIAPGILYRSGQMDARGFAETVRRHGIRLIINLQDEYPDPELPWNYFGGGTIREKELCDRLNVRYVWLPPDIISRRKHPAERPAAIDRFLALLDDPANRPALIHCRAGLHRTGVMAAVYRMEYEGYSPAEALREVRANGFGEFACTSANDYIAQYILSYRRGLRLPAPGPGSQAATSAP